MRNRRNASPQLETMESLTLLSGAAASTLALPIHAEVATTTTKLALSGTARGVFLTHPISGAKIYDIKAAGKLTPIGAATITGNLQVDSGISSGPPSGTLHLITSKGTLTLQIPRTVILPAGLPTATSPTEIVDTYVITKGTGAYKTDTGSGFVEFTFTAGDSAGNLQAGRTNITLFTSLPPTA